MGQPEKPETVLKAQQPPEGGAVRTAEAVDSTVIENLRDAVTLLCEILILPENEGKTRVVAATSKVVDTINIMLKLYKEQRQINRAL